MARHPQHATTAMWRSPWVLGAVAAVVVVGAAVGAVAVVGGPSGAGSAGGHNASSGGTGLSAAARAAQARAQLVAQLASAVTTTPAAGANEVTPTSPISIQTSQGQLSTVQVTGPSGAPVAGLLAAGGRQWQSNAVLSLATAYQIDAQVVGSDGVSAPFHSSFTTLTPTAEVSNTLFPVDAQVVGVGQPVVVHFSHAVTNAAAQASVLSHFTITESQPVAGGWHWFSASELHFRPQVYWPTGEKIVVTSDLAGWDAGGGMWGKGSVNVHFSVGDSHIGTANLATHQMVVTTNGATVATYPISGGSDKYPTMNGTHIAMGKQSVVTMDSSTVGIPVNSPDGYLEKVYSDVQISDSGEYVHAAPWSVGAQGNTNVSHGCINLSPDNASSFFDYSQTGDVIVVTGGPRPPATGDHGVMDWSTDWGQFTAGTVTAASVTTPPVSSVAPATTAAPTTAAVPTAVAAPTTAAITAPAATTVPAPAPASTTVPTTAPATTTVAPTTPAPPATQPGG